MKQKMVKRMMAFMLSAALALPGIPLETHAAGSAASPESAMNMVNFAITNPDSAVEAYIGQPLVFYVRSNGENVTYSAEGLDGLGSDEHAASLDAATGKFKWTPGAAGSRTVTFKATSGSGDDAVTISKQVAITVLNPQSTTKTAYLTATADTFVASWSNDRGKVHGGMPALVAQRYSNGAGFDDNSPLGENGHDCKLPVVKFDFSEGFKDEDGSEIQDFNLENVSNAKFMLTYIGPNSGASGDDQIAVAALDYTDWTEGDIQGDNVTDDTEKRLNWSLFNTNKGDSSLSTVKLNEGSFSVTNGYQGSVAVGSMDTFKTNKNQWTTAGKDYLIDGRQIVTDITDIFEDKVTENNKEVSLIMNRTSDANNALYFVSREGAGLGDADKKLSQIESRNMKNAAPTIILTYKDGGERSYDIAGKSYIALREGYETTGSDSFAVVGVDEGNTYEITLDGNTDDGKIKWNAQEQRLEIEEGLTKGAYELTLTATQKGSSESQSRESVTASHDFIVYVKDNVGLPVFTNPSDTVQAYVDQPLTFCVKAEDPDLGDRVSYGIEENIEQRLGCDFDETTGEFTWTPQDYHGDNSYDIKFYAYDHSKEPVEHIVTIHVADSSTLKENSKGIDVSEDTYAHTYNTEKQKNYGGQNFLRLNYDSNMDADDLENSEIGYLGEGLHSDTADTKMAFLKFDLSSLKKDDFNGAKLVLTYLGRVNTVNGRNYLGYDDVNVRIRVAKVPVDFDWEEGTQKGDGAVAAGDKDLTWNLWKEWRDENNYSVDADDFKSSPTYILSESPDLYPDLAFSSGFASVDGTKVKVDISDFVEESLSKGDDTLTLIFNNTYKGKLFVSKEGAANFTEKTALNGEPITGPQLVLLEKYETDIVDGPDGMVLAEGYETAKSDSFAVVGASSEISVTARGADNKITWDSQTNQLKIAAGLGTGTYTVFLKNNDTIIRSFNLRVAINDADVMESLLEQKVLSDTERDRYTSSSWANYRYAVLAVQSLASTGVVTGEELADGRKLIQQAREALVTLDAELSSQIEAYKNRIYSDDYYTESGKTKLTALQTAIDEAQKLLDSENLKESQINEKIAAMKAAFDTIAESDYTAKGLIQAEINEVKGQYGDDQKSGYTEASWTALQEAIQAAENVFADADATEEEISSARNEMSEAAAALETLDDALERLIQKAQERVQAESAYTEDSWEIYQTALTAVRGLSGSTYTEARMNQLLSLLDTAIGNLKLADEQIPCTCHVQVTGLSGFTMANGATKTLTPSVVIDDTGCQAPDGKHITAADVSYSYRVVDAVTAGSPSVISVTNQGVVTALANGNATIRVTITTAQPSGGNTSTTLDIPVTVNDSGIGDTVTVTFNSNGGTAVAAQEIDQNTAVSEPAAPTRAGYTFTGWYKDETLKEKYDFSQSVTEDITLYAGWTEDNGQQGGNQQTGGTVVKVGETTKIGDTEYQLAANNTLIIVKGADQAAVTIPATAKVNNIDCKVVGIGNGAYAGYKKVKKVVIGNNVASIGDQAFANCTSLTNVTIGTGVTTIGKKAFFKDKKLKTVKISGTALKSIKGQAFKGTKANIKVKLPKKMKAAQKKKIKKLLKKAKISSKAVIK